MATSREDPLASAVMALDRLHSPDLDPVSAAAWQEAWDALHEVRAQQEALLAVARDARDLIDAIDEYEEAVEAGKADLVDGLGEACVEAEEALVGALDRLHSIRSGEQDLSGEQAYLAALDRFADEDDEGGSDGTRP